MDNYSPKQAISVLKMIHIALMATPLFVAIMAVFIRSSDSSVEGLEVLLYVPWGLLFIAITTAPIVFKQGLKRMIGSGASLQSKISAYTTFHIMRMAMYEAPALLAGVVAFITGDQIVLGVVAFVAVIFILNTPSAFKMAADLELSQQEKSQLEQ